MREIKQEGGALHTAGKQSYLEESLLVQSNGSQHQQGSIVSGLIVT